MLFETLRDGGKQINLKEQRGGYLQKCGRFWQEISCRCSLL